MPYKEYEEEREHYYESASLKSVNPRDVEEIDMDFDLIQLTPNMQQMYGALLSKLRKIGENALYSALSENVETTFTNFQIIINATNEAVFKSLQRNLSKLEEIVGEDTIKIVRREKGLDSVAVKEKITKLQKVFGDMLVITG